MNIELKWNFTIFYPKKSIEFMFQKKGTKMNKKQFCETIYQKNYISYGSGRGEKMRING